ncbi:hypothetical protein AAC387_Pa09g1513 [Persea americana]
MLKTEKMSELIFGTSLLLLCLFPPFFSTPYLPLFYSLSDSEPSQRRHFFFKHKHCFLVFGQSEHSRHGGR